MTRDPRDNVEITRRGSTRACIKLLLSRDWPRARCLIWPYSRLANGRPAKIYYEGKYQEVCRIICARVHGPPPTSKHEAAHSCENGHLGCVHPKHLRWKTHKENMRECTRWKNAGASNANSKLTPQQVRSIRKSKDTPANLARKYKVTWPAIKNIIVGKNWKKEKTV